VAEKAVAGRYNTRKQDGTAIDTLSSHFSSAIDSSPEFPSHFLAQIDLCLPLVWGRLETKAQAKTVTRLLEQLASRSNILFIVSVHGCAPGPRTLDLVFSLFFLEVLKLFFSFDSKTLTSSRQTGEWSGVRWEEPMV
jgi:hypothetical protein